jgi:hypothetical protein
LTIVLPTVNTANKQDDTFNFNCTLFVWSKLNVSCESSPGEVLVPGRCHSASLVCTDRLLIFGGSAVSTNAVVVMELSALVAGVAAGVTAGGCDESDELEKNAGEGSDEKEMSVVVGERERHCNSVSLYAPKIFGIAPTKRLSALCAQVGKFFLIQGGYERERGCLSDCLVRANNKCLASFKCSRNRYMCWHTIILC